ncbi:MAG: peroxide stress protein YaaA [Magnetococcales bacterium]|nr:peroxide stress protein YaaA [Magnetococcales bacterium]
MLVLISPAKTLDTAPSCLGLPGSCPEFLDQARQLAALLQGYDAVALEKLLGISPALARLNRERYQQFLTLADSDRHKFAAELYRGDTYDGLAVDTWNREDWGFAQGHLRILSGLYGLLRPLDLIQPYRLEMSTRLVNPAGRDLYAFWGRQLADAVAIQVADHPDPRVIHLASEAYIRAVPGVALLTPVFLEERPEGLKVIALLAKRARGAMARYLITRRLTTPEPLQEFCEGGYGFRPDLSDARRWVFVRADRGELSVGA